MLDGLRWISIAACLSLAPFTFRDSSFAQQDSNRDPLAGDAAAQRTGPATKRWLAGTMSTPGMAAQLREIARATVKGKLEVQFPIFVTGAPQDTTSPLIAWPPNPPAPSPPIPELSILNGCLVVSAGLSTDQCSHLHNPEKKD